MVLEKGHKTSDEPSAETLERYLEDTLHDRIRVSPLHNVSNLPSFVSRMYRICDGRIARRRCVFLVTKDRSATPSNIAKHVGLVRSAVDAIVVFVAPALSPHNRARLIRHRVPFVVPGNQLYIPDLAIDLREHFRARRRQRVGILSPAAQAVLFHRLLRLDEVTTTPSLIAIPLHYSAMSIGRAFDELVDTGLAHTERHGKERHLRFKTEGRPLFDAARELLRSPVRAEKSVQHVHGLGELKRAGESALAELTDLSPPPLDTFAVAASDWKQTAETCGFFETDRDNADGIVETWAYDPSGLSGAHVVDRLSLYAQFRDHRDERVAIAAERLLEEVAW